MCTIRVFEYNMCVVCCDAKKTEEKCVRISISLLQMHARLLIPARDIASTTDNDV